MKQELIDMIDFSEEDYNKIKAEQDGIVSFDEFIENTISVVRDNNGTIEDAVFMANDAFCQLTH